MSSLLNSSMNGSTSNLPDSSGRSFTSSYSGQSGAASPVFQHAGSIQGHHNIHGSYNVPNIGGALGSRNSGLNNVPSAGVQQQNGNLSNGRFASNNLPVALSQLSHGSSHGHSGVTNRGGLGVSPMLGNAGPRMSNSMGSMFGGGNIGRSIGSGGGLSVPGLSSRLNLAANGGSGNLGVQGQNRLMNGVLHQGSPQVLSMLGNSYPAAGPLSQNHVQTINNLSSFGMLNDMNPNDSSPFDINHDFPQLTSRPSSAGSLRKQSLGVSHIVQQNQEFSIQNEDFPALPGFKGSNAEYSMDLHQKEQLHDNTMSMMQSQHSSIGRSAGFNLGGTYSLHRPQQQHTTSVSSSGISLHGSDIFSPSHPSYHSQTGGPLGIGLRPRDTPSSVSGAGYDQIMQQYQQHSNPSQFRLQQMSAVNQPLRDQSMKFMQTTQSNTDRFGLLGLLKVMKKTDPDLCYLALGIDLTTLGLNLNSAETLHKTFGSPWSEEPAKGDPEFSVPQCYYAQNPPPLHQGQFAKFTVDTLFYIFYSMPKDEAQLHAANELYNRGWFYLKDQRLWFIRIGEPLVKSNTYERGSYHCFDPNTFDIIRKENFVLHYEMLEKRPALPQH